MRCYAGTNARRRDAQSTVTRLRCAQRRVLRGGGVVGSPMSARGVEISLQCDPRIVWKAERGGGHLLGCRRRGEARREMLRSAARARSFQTRASPRATRAHDVVRWQQAQYGALCAL